MNESKSLLEIALMPIALSIVGILGSLIIANKQVESAIHLAEAQTEAAKEQSASDRQVKILEIFSEKITGKPQQQEMALKFLRALDSDLHQKLASAVAETGGADPILTVLAKEEQARAAQRLKNEKEDKLEISENKTQDQEMSKDICAKYSKYTKEQWKKDFQNAPVHGSWHVFVATLGKGVNEQTAKKVLEDYNYRFPNQDFDYIPTINLNSGQNQRYAIIIAAGIQKESTARDIARYADKCGIADGAYPYRQGF